MKNKLTITPGDDMHMNCLMAPYSLNMVVGEDRQHLLAFGKAAFAAGQKSAAHEALQAGQVGQAPRNLLEQFDLDHSADYQKGREDGRIYGYKVGYRHATEHLAQPAPQPAPVPLTNMEKSAMFKNENTRSLSARQLFMSGVESTEKHYGICPR